MQFDPSKIAVLNNVSVVVPNIYLQDFLQACTEAGAKWPSGRKPLDYQSSIDRSPYSQIVFAYKSFPPSRPPRLIIRWQDYSGLEDDTFPIRDDNIPLETVMLEEFIVNPDDLNQLLDSVM